MKTGGLMNVKRLALSGGGGRRLTEVGAGGVGRIVEM